ncbi:hypothetical protein A6C57_00290 [Fibrella sp. ES10-3-2-2]|nr:hypothetical protein A6C57_00290 [Fibrella sp. ES10-3-2-2]
MHRDKVYARLKAKFQNKGFSEKTINAVADIVEVGVTEETQVDAAVDGAEPYLNVIQKEVDVRVEKEKLKLKQEADEGKEGQEGSEQGGGTGGNAAQQNATGGDDAMPAWAKPLMTTLQAVVADVNGMKSGSVAKTRREQFEAKLKDVPEALKTKALKDFDRMKFDTDEDFTTFLTETETDFKPIIQENLNSGLGQQHRPLNAQPATGKALDDAIDAWAGGKSATATTTK